MTRESDLHLFAEDLNRAVVRDVLSWRDHPDLHRLTAKLISHTSRKAFLDSFAEAMIARHLLAHGCSLKLEVPTPSHKRSDFEVSRDSQHFFLHVKRIETERPPHHSSRMAAMMLRLRRLERIARPYIVQVRWEKALSNEQMRMFVDAADAFIRSAKIGDELAARDNDGRQIGGVRILAPWDGDHVNLAISMEGGASGFVDRSPRFRKLMHRAYQQFMPRSVNVILICSDHRDDVIDFENALLGAHVERWDAFPPRGRRIAHGRSPDGLWHGQHFAESRFAGWFHFNPAGESLNSRLWVRRDLPVEPEMERMLQQIFDSQVG